MRLRLGRLCPLVAALFVLACGGNAATSPNGAGGAGGAGDGGSPTGGKSGFQPVPTQQPTEAGAWVVDPRDPLTLYALGDRSLRSRDGGHTWSDLGWPSGARGLLFAQGSAPALYLRVQDKPQLASNNLLKSLDEGATWTDPGVVIVGALALVDQDPQPVLMNVREDGIWRSTDDGTTWLASSSDLPSSNQLPAKFGQILVSSGASPTLYVEASAYDEASAAGFKQSVLVSTDAGARFVVESMPGGLLLFDPPKLSLDCLGRLYFLVGNTVNRSNDAGRTWEKVVGVEADVTSFEVTPSAPTECSDTVYAFGQRAQGPTFWRLDAAGGVTSQAAPQSGSLSDLGRDRLLLVTELGGLRQRSDDGGRSWWTAGVDLALAQLALSPAQAGLIFASAVNTVFRSGDAGETWQGSPAVPSIQPQYVYPDSVDPNVLYASGIYDSPWTYISTDGGASFQTWPVPSPANPEIPSAIASSASGTVRVVTDRGVYATDDRGQHFASLLSLPKPKSILWASIGTTEPPSIYAYVAGEDTAAHEIVASLDGGATWSSSDPGSAIQCVVAHPTDPQIAFACPIIGDQASLLRTLDGGNTWSRITTPDAAYSLRIDPQPPHALYALGQHLYRSQDQGATWQSPVEIPSNVYSFELDPLPGGARYTLSQNGLLEKWVE